MPLGIDFTFTRSAYNGTEGSGRVCGVVESLSISSVPLHLKLIPRIPSGSPQVDPVEGEVICLH